MPIGVALPSALLDPGTKPPAKGGAFEDVARRAAYADVAGALWRHHNVYGGWADAEASCGEASCEKFMATTTPYQVSYARLAPGLLNSPEEVDEVLEAIGALAQPGFSSRNV